MRLTSAVWIVLLAILALATLVVVKYGTFESPAPATSKSEPKRPPDTDPFTNPTTPR